MMEYADILVFRKDWAKSFSFILPKILPTPAYEYVKHVICLLAGSLDDYCAGISRKRRENDYGYICAEVDGGTLLRCRIKFRARVSNIISVAVPEVLEQSHSVRLNESRLSGTNST